MDNFDEKHRNMKYALLTSFILLGISSQAQTDLKKLTWLTGTWERTNAKTGRSGVEIWKVISDVEMTGRGISLKGNDTTFVEKLKIIINHFFFSLYCFLSFFKTINKCSEKKKGRKERKKKKTSTFYFKNDCCKTFSFLFF